MTYRPALPRYAAELRAFHRVCITNWFVKENDGVELTCRCGRVWVLGGGIQAKGLRRVMAQHLAEQQFLLDAGVPQ